MKDISSEAILDVNDLCMSYGKVEALHHVSLKVRPGEIVTVIGPNGAGKTTLLSVIMGVLPFARGEIRYQGEASRHIDIRWRAADARGWSCADGAAEDPDARRAEPGPRPADRARDLPRHR